jgi:ABC-2 type transport system ATP-binding protein
MILVRDLTKSIAGKPILRNVSFEIAEGVVALLGRNGAGKTTLMRLAAGLWKPDAGEILIGGRDLAREPVEAKRLLGYQPEFADLHPGITGRDLLRFAAAAHGISDDALERTAHRFGGLEFLDQRAGTLSQGQRRVITLIAATMHEPPVLLLDEPTNALDPHRVAALRELLASPAGPRATLVSTHQLEFVVTLATRFILLREGTIVADGDLPSLQAQLGMRGATLGEIVLRNT